MIQNGGFLPEDIWRLIFQRLVPPTDAYKVWKPLAFEAAPKGDVANLSSTCKSLRLCGEGYLFRRIAFIQRPIKRGDDSVDQEAFWTTTCERLRAMVQSDKARTLVVELQFSGSTATSGTEANLEELGFWVLFFRALQHLSTLECVHLDMPLQGVPPPSCPPTLRHALYTQSEESQSSGVNPAHSDQGKKAAPFRTRQAPLWERLVARLSFIEPKKTQVEMERSEGMLIREETMSDQRPRNEGLSREGATKVSFSSIKTVALSARVSWILYHCPNLINFMSLDEPDSYPGLPTLTILGSHSAALRTLKLDYSAYKSNLKEVASACPDIEDLALYPPTTMLVLPFEEGDYVTHFLNTEELKTVPPVFRSFPRLRIFALCDYQHGGALPDKADAQLPASLQDIMIDIVRESNTIQEIRFGAAVRRRVSNWDGSVLEVAPEGPQESE